MTPTQALAELVALKDLKDRFVKMRSVGIKGDAASCAEARRRTELWNDYNRRKPLAWDAARAALAQAEGWVMVPKEPTEAMLEAGRGAVMARDCSGPNWGPADHFKEAGYPTDGIPARLLEGKGPMSKSWGAELVYAAMIAAAQESKE